MIQHQGNSIKFTLKQTAQCGYRIGMLALLVFCELSHANNTEKLSPFTSDGCSMFPNGTPSSPSLWVNCCIQHDLAYWAGGTLNQKRQADQALSECVKNTGQTTISHVMHTGVFLGGSAYYLTPYRWGYGWPYLRGYKTLTPQEKAAVISQLNHAKNQIDTFKASLNGDNEGT